MILFCWEEFCESFCSHVSREFIVASVLRPQRTVIADSCQPVSDSQWSNWCTAASLSTDQKYSGTQARKVIYSVQTIVWGMTKSAKCMNRYAYRWGVFTWRLQWQTTTLHCISRPTVALYSCPLSSDHMTFRSLHGECLLEWVSRKNSGVIICAQVPHTHTHTHTYILTMKLHTSVKFSGGVDLRITNIWQDSFELGSGSGYEIGLLTAFNQIL